MIKMLGFLIAFTSTFYASAVQLEFVPYNPSSKEATERTKVISDISKSLNKEEKKKLKSLKFKYKKMLQEEKAKNTPVESRREIKRIKTEYFTSMIESLRPETVSKIMDSKRTLATNKTLNDSSDKIQELFLKAEKIKKTDN
ncbi:hypothetical protein [Pseudoalteromonas marina]|uniref:Uncharacterized protein n=1 Tax=Pseudoalteromonas marina TaxID=267375 RepID=A0ABT9FGE9_9GAMM|nr:hypothetical protein [Pseudoalteromonas marina]MDP2565854.1 hypothetical protein [Pseudoalteromonas marina]